MLAGRLGDGLLIDGPGTVASTPWPGHPRRSWRSRSSRARRRPPATVPAWSTAAPRSGPWNDGNPRGMSSDKGDPRAARSRSADATRPPTSRTRAPGTRGATHRRPKTTTRATTPTTTVARWSLVRGWTTTTRTPGTSCCLSLSVPGQLRQFADDDVDGCAEEESGDDSPGQELGQPGHPEHCEREEEQATHVSVMPATRVAASVGWFRLAASTAPPGHGRQARAGTHRDLAAGAEQGVEDRPGGGGIESVLGAAAQGDLGVAEILGDDQRRHHDTGNEVDHVAGPLGSGAAAGGSAGSEGPTPQGRPAELSGGTPGLMGPLACPGSHQPDGAGFGATRLLGGLGRGRTEAACSLLVCCSPETSRPLAARNALSSAVAWKASEGAALASTARGSSTRRDPTRAPRRCACSAPGAGF